MQVKRRLAYHLYWDLKAIANGNFNTIGANKLAEGRFAQRDLRTHQQMRRDFRQWHLQACQQLGKERVKAVYRLCYGADWSLIAQILYPSPRFLAVRKSPPILIAPTIVIKVFRR
jgi:hypothetical protein